MVWPEKLAFALAVGAVLTPLSGYFAILLYPEIWGFFLFNLFVVATYVLTESAPSQKTFTTLSAFPLFPAYLSSLLGWPTTLVLLPSVALLLRNRPMLFYILAPIIGAAAAFATFHLWPAHSGDASFDLFLAKRRDDIRFNVVVALTGFFVGAVFGRSMYENTR